MRLALRLYFTGGSPLSESARHEVNRLKDRFPDVEFEIEEIDVVFNPLMAEQNGVSATPTIIKFSPSPVVKIVCDLTDLERSLGLKRSPGRS
jgi:hypothetical protein